MQTAEQRLMFDSYADLHHRCKQDQACLRKALVWQCDESDLCGGLGDEIRGLVFTAIVAMAVGRPFFVKWQRMHVNMLDVFSNESIDASMPQSLKNCRHDAFIDSKLHPTVLFDIASAGKSCNVWTTNYNLLTLLRDAQVLQERLPGIVGIPAESVVGCFMNILFRPPAATPADWRQFDGTRPEHYVAVHFRCDDSDFGRGGIAKESREVSHALQCAQGPLEAQTVVFVSCSESAKMSAKLIAQRRGLTLLVARTMARHVDHDHKSLSMAQFHSAILGDFNVMQDADAVVFAGERVSGFAYMAASIGLVPGGRFMKVSLESPPCERLRRDQKVR